LNTVRPVICETLAGRLKDTMRAGALGSIADCWAKCLQTCAGSHPDLCCFCLKVMAKYVNRRISGTPPPAAAPPLPCDSSAPKFATAELQQLNRLSSSADLVNLSLYWVGKQTIWIFTLCARLDVVWEI
jgi:hypothetical protein